MTREDKLRWLIQHRFGGSQADCARAIGKAASQVGQWTGGHRRLGGAGARDIELALGLLPGWFDLDAAGVGVGVAEPVETYLTKPTTQPPDPILAALALIAAQRPARAALLRAQILSEAEDLEHGASHPNREAA